MIAQDIEGKHSRKVSEMKKIHAVRNVKRHKAPEFQKQFQRSARGKKVAYCPNALSSRERCAKKRKRARKKPKLSRFQGFEAILDSVPRRADMTQSVETPPDRSTR